MPTIVCPTCATKLEIDDDMVGEDVQCGSCQQVFKAETEKKRPSRRGEVEDADEKPRKSKYRQDVDEVEEERPSRRKRMSSEDDDDDDEDYTDRRSRRKSQQGGGQGLGIASMILGIIGLLGVIATCWCCPLFDLPFPILALVFGFLSLKTPGKGMGIAGMATGGIALVLILLFTALHFAGAGLNAAGGGGGGGGLNNQGRFK